MNQQATKCVETLATHIEEDEDGNWRYSDDGSRFYDYLMPILVEKLDINPSGLRVSERRVYGKINNLLLDVRDESEPTSVFDSRIDEIIEDISNLDVVEYTVAFPLNYDKRSRDLLPDTLVFRDTEFESIDFSSWEHDWVPEYEEPDGDRDLTRLCRFLKDSPNDIYNQYYTYWQTTCYARDQQFAMDHSSKALTTILGQINYAMTYNRTQGRGSHSGPWPSRWSELRSPFIFLIYQDGEYLSHYFPTGDASYRKPESPHSMREEAFEHVLSWLPTFETEESIDPRLIESFNMFQSGITNTSYEQGFFEFWRGLEILASIDDDLQSTDDDDAISGIVERVAQIYDWSNPEIAEIRQYRIANKRNEYVHEGEYESINRNDYNFMKSLLEGIIDFACDKRTDWDVGDWIYVLRNFETDNDRLDNKERELERNLELLDEMKEFGDS
jgi:hypothetical protein